MKSRVIDAVRLDEPVEQRHDLFCTPHGWRACTRPIVAVITLKTKVAEQRYRSCEAWLTENTDVVEYLARVGYSNR